uniref:Uncharacterized protein n=1 Tax=Arundo donax TaxID=35708 RepID=A0A0A8ZR26_ARUDO
MKPHSSIGFCIYALDWGKIIETVH